MMMIGMILSEIDLKHLVDLTIVRFTVHRLVLMPLIVWLVCRLLGISAPEADLTENYVSFAFLQEGRAVSGGTALFCAPKHFRFRNPGLTVRREGEELVVKAEAYAQSVQIQSEDPDLLLSDNFFSMDPGEKRVRILRGKAGKLSVRSVFDIA